MNIFHYIFIGVAGGIMKTAAQLPYDASSVTWAHAVNSREKLEETLAGEINFLEADVSFGNVTGPDPAVMVPIMAHPPDRTSDISLETWIQKVISAKRNKGVKLDFKFLEIVEASLKIIHDHKDKMKFPLWLNADILPGPVEPTTTPVDSTQFLSLCQQYFPQATLSVGWTTRPNNQSVPGSYTWKNVKDMAESLVCSKINQLVTFPVRAIFVKSSLSQLIWLLDIFPTSTLTVWSGILDDVNIDGLLELRSLTSVSRVYYDLPGRLNQQFHDKKDHIQPKLRLPGFINYKYTVLGDDESCANKLYLTPSTVLFTGQKKGVVFHRIFSPDIEVKISGKIYFFNDASPMSSIHLFINKASSFPDDFNLNGSEFSIIENSAMFSSKFSNVLNNLQIKLQFSHFNGSLYKIIGGEVVETVAFNYNESAVVSFISEGGSSIIYEGEFTSVFSSSYSTRANLLLLMMLVMFLHSFI